ncbi:hypothetical protein BDV33DRAFT_198441 [Aspergillus novoparasiticus]|uniref:MD-2-related lipid-recognition domain-containing protein n=1 Tax=Aspergillus novoparasiticus TaxID=986946 RepID=A0A5N6F7B8_9EURO|nr:hypothetical protein BDV33DRAFT_198441 [Aspergillus novoparasiticus]
MKAGPTLILSTLLGLSQALQLTAESWSPCEGHRAVNIVDISPCDAEPCVLAQGKKYTVSMSGENGESAINDVHLNIDGYFAGWTSTRTPKVEDGLYELQASKGEGTKPHCNESTSAKAYEADALGSVMKQSHSAGAAECTVPSVISHFRAIQPKGDLQRLHQTLVPHFNATAR